MSVPKASSMDELSYSTTYSRPKLYLHPKGPFEQFQLVNDKHAGGCGVATQFTTMDEKRSDKDYPDGGTHKRSMSSSKGRTKLEVKQKMMKKQKTSATATGRARVSSLVSPVGPSIKSQTRLPHMSCSRTVTYDYKKGRFVAKKPIQRRRHVKRIKLNNVSDCGHSKSVVLKTSTARKTTKPGCHHYDMDCKTVHISETMEPAQRKGFSKLYQLQHSEDSLSTSDILHKSKLNTEENFSPAATSKVPLGYRRDCRLGSPRIPAGYPCYQHKKKEGQKTARASLRNRIPAKQVKYSSMQLAHQVLLQKCRGVHQPGKDDSTSTDHKVYNRTDEKEQKNREMKDGRYELEGRSTSGKTCTGWNVSRPRCPDLTGMGHNEMELRTGERLETLVSKLWSKVCQVEGVLSQTNRAGSSYEPKGKKVQGDDVSSRRDCENRPANSKYRQQKSQFQTDMDRPRCPTNATVDDWCGETCWNGEAERHGLSLRLCSEPETIEPPESQTEVTETDVETPPVLEWMGDMGVPTCNHGTSPPQLDRIEGDLSCNPATVSSCTKPVDLNILGAESSSLQDQKHKKDETDISTTTEAPLYPTCEVTRPGKYCGMEQGLPREMLTFSEDPYPDVDMVNGDYFMSFSNQESLEAHRQVEARVQDDFKLDSKLFIRNVQDFKLLSGKQNRKQETPEGWKPGLHNRHTKYNMMLVEEVLKRRYRQSRQLTTQSTASSASSVVQKESTKTSHNSQANSEPCKSQRPYVPSVSRKRKSDNKLVSQLLGCEKLHWKKKARLMWDMVQAGCCGGGTPGNLEGTETSMLQDCGCSEETVRPQTGTPDMASSVQYGKIKDDSKDTMEETNQRQNVLGRCFNTGEARRIKCSMNTYNVTEPHLVLQPSVEGTCLVRAETKKHTKKSFEGKRAQTSVLKESKLHGADGHQFILFGDRQPAGSDEIPTKTTAMADLVSPIILGRISNGASGKVLYLKTENKNKGYSEPTVDVTSCHACNDPFIDRHQMSQSSGLSCEASDLCADDPSGRSRGDIHNKWTLSKNPQICPGVQVTHVYKDKTAVMDLLRTTCAERTVSCVNSSSRHTQKTIFPDADCLDSLASGGNSLHVVTCPALFAAADVGCTAGQQVQQGQPSRWGLGAQDAEYGQRELGKLPEMTKIARFQPLGAPQQRTAENRTHSTGNINIENGGKNMQECVETPLSHTYSNVMTEWCDERKIDSQTFGKKCTCIGCTQIHCSSNSNTLLKTARCPSVGVPQKTESNNQRTKSDDSNTSHHIDQTRRHSRRAVRQAPGQTAGQNGWNYGEDNRTHNTVRTAGVRVKDKQCGAGKIKQQLKPKAKHGKGQSNATGEEREIHMECTRTADIAGQIRGCFSVVSADSTAVQHARTSYSSDRTLS